MTKPEIIAEATRRLVEFYNPLRIYLFAQKPEAKPARIATSISWSSSPTKRGADF